MPSDADIVRALAALPEPQGYHDYFGGHVCALCVAAENAYGSATGFAHTDGCPWRLARDRYPQEHPADPFNGLAGNPMAVGASELPPDLTAPRPEPR